MHGTERMASLPTSPTVSENASLVDSADVLGSACRVHVAGIPFEVMEDELKCVFSQFGRVSRIKLAMDPVVAGRHRGTGVVEFVRPEAVDLALQVLQKAELNGHAIKLMRPHDWKQSSLADASLKKLVYFSNISALVSDSDLKEMLAVCCRTRAFHIKSASWTSTNEKTTLSLSSPRCMIVEFPNSAIAKSVIGAFSQRIVLAQRVVYATGCVLSESLDPLLVSNDDGAEGLHREVKDDEQRMVRLSNFPPVDGSDAQRELQQDVLEECQAIARGAVASVEYESESSDGSVLVVTVADEKDAERIVSVMDNRYFDGRRISASRLLS